MTFDEIDKLGAAIQVDPSVALFEVRDLIFGPAGALSRTCRGWAAFWHIESQAF
jgi:hypothetical protein